MDKPRIYLSSPHMGPDELGLVKEAFATNWIAPLGPHVDAFEREFAAAVGNSSLLDEGNLLSGKSPNHQSPITNTQAPLHAAALSSGTAALHLALRLVGVQRDDEVLVSTLTFSASVNPILYEGGRPVFIDSERASWNMDPARLEDALAERQRAGRRPKAVVLVHLYGQSADLDAIQAICDRHGVPLIEDAAEALGARYWGSGQLSDERNRLMGKGGKPSLSVEGSQSSGKAINDQSPATNNQPQLTNNATALRGVAPGTRGRIGIYSFNGNKIITTSGGGMLVSADAALVAKARFLATQARDAAPHYQHSEVGFNYRLSNVLAGIGRGQLRVLADRVNARRANTAFYQKALGDLPGLAFMPEAPWGRCTRWLTCITIDPAAAGTDREKVRLALADEAIEARPVWKPMHLQPVFAGAPVHGGAVAEDLFDRGLCLPSGSNLTATDLERVVAVVRHCWGR